MASDVQAPPPDQPPDNLHLARELLTSTYRDACSRSNTLRGSALVSLALFSTFVALAGPEDIARMGIRAVPVTILAAAGLVSALAVLLPTKVTVPYDTTVLESPEFILLRFDTEAAQKALLHPVAQAEAETRRLNTRAAWLMNASLSCFVGAVVALSFQLGLGASNGLIIGLPAAAAVVAAAHVAKKVAFAPPKQPRREART